jgi:hypothetical protein
MPEAVPLLVVQLGMSLAAYAAVGFWFVRPWLLRMPFRDALSILVLPEMFRHIGITLLSAEVVDPSFPREMAWQTAIGDVLTALLAWCALLALRAGWRHAVAVVWTMNVVGLGDMLHNLATGVRLQVADDLGGAWLGITFVVPLMLAVHLLNFWFLLRAPRGWSRS